MTGAPALRRSRRFWDAFPSSDYHPPKLTIICNYDATSLSHPSPSRTLASTLFSENAEDAASCARLRRISTWRSRTSMSMASSAWRRDMPRRPSAANDLFPQRLCQLVEFAADGGFVHPQHAGDLGQGPPVQIIRAQHHTVFAREKSESLVGRLRPAEYRRRHGLRIRRRNWTPSSDSSSRLTRRLVRR